MLPDILKAFAAVKLSRSEQIALEHFAKKPEGRGFFAAAEILAKYDRAEEAIQVLSQGLERHPHYSVARVYLAFLLSRRHFFREAWTVIEGSPSSLRGNLTAQVIRLKLAVILANEGLARSLAQELSQQDFQDAEARIIIEQIHVKPFAALRRDYAEHLKWKGIEPAGFQKSRVPDAEAGKSKDSLSAASIAPKDHALADAEFRERVARGFFSSPVHDIFLKEAPASSAESSLDDLTKARLLRRQGLYQNALDIYDRLVYSSPGNELLRREMLEARDLRDNQRAIDQKLDPQLVDAMEKVREIDRRIAILQHLMGFLDEHEAAP